MRKCNTSVNVRLRVLSIHININEINSLLIN
jgi:hypothetical protein